MRLTEPIVTSRAGAWTRWYPSREARLRARSWTSRALLAKGCLDDSAIPPTVRCAPTRCAGHQSSALKRPLIVVPRLGYHRGRVPARSHWPHAGEHEFALRRAAQLLGQRKDHVLLTADDLDRRMATP